MAVRTGDSERNLVKGVALAAVLAAGLAAATTAVHAQNFGSINTQCPGDLNGDGIPDVVVAGHPNVKCMHLAAGDGYITMADGKPIYTFGFTDVTGKLPSEVMNAGLAAANYPAPTIELNEGQEFYLSLTNVGMILRPDLFDGHSVHFHGFPQAASIFDGVPESSIAIAMGSTMTYYYSIVDGLAGTYMYHCHVEATEHIQMGMVGNLFINPRQNGTSKTWEGRTYTKFVYNDGDGSTGYNVSYPIQLGGIDSNFHDQHIAIQPLPFNAMRDNYALLNGRGYPDTINPDPIGTDSPAGVGVLQSQKVSSLINANAGERILLRVSNLGVQRFYTIGSTLPMQVVGHNAKHLVGPSGTKLYYSTNSVTLGGGESYDVLIDTKDVTPGTYLLYTTNLNYLSNDKEDYGGMMTEIHVN